MAAPIRSAGILIIGDEVLNGKILDTNSHEFAKFCFNKLKIPLKRTVVCGDDEQDIIDSLQTLKDCSLIITSGGIGSTHDDVTYSSIAKAYGLPLEVDNEIVSRMHKLSPQTVSKLSNDSLSSFYRMATIPVGPQVSKTFISNDLWVPVVGIQESVYILPGVPHLFKILLNGLLPNLIPRIDQPLNLTRRFVKTKVSEHIFANFLKQLQLQCDNEFGFQQVKLSSYPHIPWKINTISIISGIDSNKLDQIVDKIIQQVEGQEISAQQEAALTETSPDS